MLTIGGHEAIFLYRLKCVISFPLSVVKQRKICFLENDVKLFHLYEFAFYHFLITHCYQQTISDFVFGDYLWLRKLIQNDKQNKNE